MSDSGPQNCTKEHENGISVVNYLLHDKSENKTTNIIGVQIPKFIVIHEVSKSYNYKWCDIEHYRRLIMLHSTPANRTLRINSKEIECRKKLNKLIIYKSNIYKDIENGDLINIKTGELMNPKLDFDQEKKGAPPYVGWGSTVGYHYLVSDKKIYRFIPDNISTEHTGTDYGNCNSIGIERIVCSGTDWDLAIHNQAKLSATLMVKWKIPLNRVVTHKRIQELFGDDNQKNNPKQCPNALLNGYNGNLKDFFTDIKKCLLNCDFFTECFKTNNLTKDDLQFITNEVNRIKQEDNKKIANRLLELNKYKNNYEKLERIATYF